MDKYCPILQQCREETVLDMSREVETLYMNQDDDCEEDEDWELVSKDQIEDVCKDTLITQKARGFVLRMSGFTGPVSFLTLSSSSLIYRDIFEVSTYSCRFVVSHLTTSMEICLQRLLKVIS